MSKAAAPQFFGRRGAISRLATKLTHRLVGTSLSDPMSGFFMMRRDRFEEIAPRLSPVGFKILLDIAATGGERLAIAEQPYVFGKRFEGESKFNAQIGVEFLGLLLAKMTGDLVDPRFLLFRHRRHHGSCGASGGAQRLALVVACPTHSVSPRSSPPWWP